MTQWLSNKKKVQANERGRLWGHLLNLKKYGLARFEGLQWLAGPEADPSGLHRIRVNGQVAVRVYLCRGPLSMVADGEITLLFGTFKVDGLPIPADAGDKALANKNRIKSESDRAPFGLV